MYKYHYFVSVIVSFLFISSAYAIPSNLPTGYWKTIDDVTKKARAVIQIEDAGNNQFSGRVVKVFPQPGVKENEFCTACTGARHNQRILGMTIMEGLKPEKDKVRYWSNGKILDPKTGKIYNCKMHMTESGQKLEVRGYLGLSLFGRTQTWLRVQKEDL